MFGLVAYSYSMTAKAAQIEKKEALDRLAQAEQENALISAKFRAYDDAVKGMLAAMDKAEELKDERITTIEKDPAAADWLVCPVPDSVRAAFGSDGLCAAAGGADETVPTAESHRD
jgi:hypothetical protein